VPTCRAARGNAQVYEDSHPQGGGKSAAEDEDGGARRAEAVRRLVAIARAAGLADENVHDAVMLLDRLLRLGLGREAANPAVLAGIAVLSTKQGARPESQRKPRGRRRRAALRGVHQACVLFHCSQQKSQQQRRFDCSRQRRGFGFGVLD
jgi:hypothetical protein